MKKFKVFKYLFSIILVGLFVLSFKVTTVSAACYQCKCAVGAASGEYEECAFVAVRDPSLCTDAMCQSAGWCANRRDKGISAVRGPVDYANCNNTCTNDCVGGDSGGGTSTCDLNHATQINGARGQDCADCIIANARDTVGGTVTNNLLDYYRVRYGMVNTDCGLNVYYPILYCKPNGDHPSAAICNDYKGSGTGVCGSVCKSGTASACSLPTQYQTAITGVGSSCASCIADPSRMRGSIDWIKQQWGGNETCTDLQVVTHMCNGGVSDPNKQGCLGYKNGACASACSGTGSTALSATIAGPTGGSTADNLSYTAKADGTNLRKVFIYIARTTATLTDPTSWTLLNQSAQDCGGSSHCEKTVSFMPSANNVSYYVVVNAQDNSGHYCSGSPATTTPATSPCKSGSDRITLTTTSSTPPTGQTWKYRVAENPTDLASAEWQLYTANGLTFPHNFNVTGPATGYIFVEFMDINGKTGGCGENGTTPCQASIDILGPTLSTCTAFTPDGLTDGGTDPGTGATIYKTSSYNDVGVRTLSATYSPTTATLTPASSDSALSFGHRQSDNKPYVVIPTNDDTSNDKNHTVSATVAASGGTAANCPSFIIRVPKKPGNTTCTYTSTQARMKTGTGTVWSAGLSAALGTPVLVAGFHNNTLNIQNDVLLTATGPAGDPASSTVSLTEDVTTHIAGFTPDLAGTYTITATTEGKEGNNCTGNATLTVTASSSPSPTPSTRIPGDATNDGCVNYYDKDCWANEYGAAGPYSADFDNSGHVDLADYAIWLSANNSGRYVCSAGQARITCVNR